MSGSWGRKWRSNSTRGLKELTRDIRETVAQTAEEEREEAELLAERPRVRADCVGAMRPCPWVGCRYHLFLEANDTGSLTFNHPESALEELEETCALDVADAGGVTLERVGELLNVSRERIRQIETVALRHTLDSGIARLK